MSPDWKRPGVFADEEAIETLPCRPWADSVTIGPGVFADEEAIETATPRACMYGLSEVREYSLTKKRLRLSVHRPVASTCFCPGVFADEEAIETSIGGLFGSHR